MKTDKKLIFVILGVVIVAFAVGLIARLRVPGGHLGPLESMTLGAQLLEGAIPIFVAQEQGFFTQNGLNVTVKGYDTGLKSLDGMLKGETDVAATVSEYVMVGKIFGKQPVKIIGSLERTDCISIS